MTEEPRVPVFFNVDAVPEGHSPRTLKPAMLIDNWLRKYGDKITVYGHGPANFEELATVHDGDYITSMLSLRRPNGFGDLHPRVPRSVLHTVGGMINAARAAVSGGFGAVALPYSDFHRAHRNYGFNGCTFNGLAAAAINLLEDRMVDSVLILDCDFGIGDGTQEIIDSGEEETSGVFHWSAGMHFHQSKEAPQFFKALEEVLTKHKHVDLVLYQAGADFHRGDPLGGVLTSTQMKERDKLVFEFCNDAGIPVVWNVGGGFRPEVEKTLAIHDQTMRECIKANIG